jgi:hypothetical protein
MIVETNDMPAIIITKSKKLGMNYSGAVFGMFHPT